MEDAGAYFGPWAPGWRPAAGGRTPQLRTQFAVQRSSERSSVMTMTY